MSTDPAGQEEVMEAVRLVVSSILERIDPADHDQVLQALLLTSRAMLIARRDLRRAAQGRGLPGGLEQR